MNVSKGFFFLARNGVDHFRSVPGIAFIMNKKAKRYYHLVIT